MTLLRLICLFCLALLRLDIAVAEASQRPDKDWSIGKLENRLKEIDAELDLLASFSWRSDVGALGYPVSVPWYK